MLITKQMRSQLRLVIALGSWVHFHGNMKGKVSKKKCSQKRALPGWSFIRDCTLPVSIILLYNLLPQQYTHQCSSYAGIGNKWCAPFHWQYLLYIYIYMSLIIYTLYSKGNQWCTRFHCQWQYKCPSLQEYQFCCQYLCPFSAARWSGVSPLVSVQLMFTGFRASKLQWNKTTIPIISDQAMFVTSLVNVSTHTHIQTCIQYVLLHVFEFI